MTPYFGWLALRWFPQQLLRLFAISPVATCEAMLTVGLLVVQSAALVPQAYRAPVRQVARPSAAAPQMLFNLGKETEVEEIVVERSEPTYIEPEPGYANPGKATYSEMELAEQSAKMDALAAKWRKREEQVEYDGARITGFVGKAETINGRLAMFFLLTGLATEYFTGESIPGQVLVMFETLGIID